MFGHNVCTEHGGRESSRGECSQNHSPLQETLEEWHLEDKGMRHPQQRLMCSPAAVQDNYKIMCSWKVLSLLGCIQRSLARSYLFLIMVFSSLPGEFHHLNIPQFYLCELCRGERMGIINRVLQLPTCAMWCLMHLLMHRKTPEYIKIQFKMFSIYCIVAEEIKGPFQILI